MKKRTLLPVLAMVLLGGCASPAMLATIDRADLESVRKAVKKEDKAVKPAFDALVSRAEKALEAEPLSIVNQTVTPPSGDKHDYMSMGPYWWPDPTKPDGLPYIRRDGEHNPEFYKMESRGWLEKTCNRVQDLSYAWYLTGEEKYASKAAELLRVFFIDPETRMNPNLTFGQSIPGRCTGRGIGLIDTYILGRTIDAFILLDGSASWTAKDKAALQDWIRTFYKWMLESEIGMDEGRQPNNHASAYDFQICAYAIYCGEPEVARRQLEQVTFGRMDIQFPADASQPLELKRTNSWGYSTANLNMWMGLVNIGDRLGIDLWSWKNKVGVSLKEVVEWYFPHILEGKPWFKKDLSKTRQPGNIDRIMRVYCRKFCPGRYPEFVEGIKKFTNSPKYDFDTSVYNLLYPVNG